MKIVLDFDDTILNTGELLARFSKIFEGAGFAREEFMANYEKSKDIAGDFDIETIIELFAKTRAFNKEKTRKEYDLVLDKISDLVYPDFFDFVGSFNKEDLILLSISNSKTNFQGIKIEKTEIVPFFSSVIITPVDKVVEMELMCQRFRTERFFLIDDKADQVDKVKAKLCDVVTMKMERVQGRHSEKKSKSADYVIKDFIGARDIINKIIKQHENR